VGNQNALSVGQGVLALTGAKVVTLNVGWRDIGL
jgi:hypothetical protein